MGGKYDAEKKEIGKIQKLFVEDTKGIWAIFFTLQSSSPHLIYFNKLLIQLV